MSANRAGIAVAALSLVAATAYAGPPFQALENGFDNPATVHREPAPSTSRAGEAFPWAINDAGFDNPATIYPQRSAVRTAGSAFPWTVNEAGPYVAESVPAIGDDSHVRTAKR